MTLPFNRDQLEGLGISIDHPHFRRVADRFAELLNVQSGQATILAAAASVNVDLDAALHGSPAWAVIEQATADGTLTYITRVFWAAATQGRLTIVGDAAATANTVVRWFVLPVSPATRQ
jgi:hypothetical protein